MSREQQMVEEIYNKWSEYLQEMSDNEVYNFMLKALAVEAVREREDKENYKMALKRCEIMKR